MLRVLAILVFLAGGLIGFGYPYLVDRFGGRDIGTYRVQDAQGGFRPATVALAPADAPVRVVLDATAVEQGADRDGTVLTLTVATGGQTVLADALDAAEAEIRDDSPQTPQRILRFSRRLEPVPAGDYLVTVGPGDAEGFTLLSVDLTVSGSGFFAPDERAQPIGLSVMAVGFILIALTFRRRTVADDRQPPKPPQWGRGPG